MDQEIKIRVEGLQKGMFVSRVDRPWAELPTHLEGLLINNNEDIDMISSYCHYVYIDTEKGRSANPIYWVNEQKTESMNEFRISDAGKKQFDLLKKEEYQTNSSIDKEITTAREIYTEVSSKLQHTFKELNMAGSFKAEELEDIVLSTVDSVLRNPIAFQLVLELKRADKHSYNRALGTSVWCAQFGRHLGLEKRNIIELSMGGLLLDIGKTQIPEQLLCKVDTLTDDEILLLRSHVDLGVQILVQQENIPHNVMQMVATHHERFNGSGYPQGLKEQEIPLFGKIAGIADSFDAMTCHRPFLKRAHSPHEAISDIYNLRGRLFNADLVEQFIQAVGVYPIGSLVELEDHRVGVVFSINGLKRLRPTVMMVLDENKRPLKNFEQINLSERDDLKIKNTLPRGSFGIQMDELFI